MIEAINELLSIYEDHALGVVLFCGSFLAVSAFLFEFAMRSL